VNTARPLLQMTPDQRQGFGRRPTVGHHRLAADELVDAAALLATSGCAVLRDQQTAGAYVDDTALTTRIKARFIESKEVDASAIGVETLNGTVMLSGFAKSLQEKVLAEGIARNVSGVVAVRNELAVRP